MPIYFACPPGLLLKVRSAAPVLTWLPTSYHTHSYRPESLLEFDGVLSDSVNVFYIENIWIKRQQQQLKCFGSPRIKAAIPSVLTIKSDILQAGETKQ